MKRILTFIIILVLVISMRAQNEYRIGDVLHTLQVSYVSFDKTEGQGLYWNMKSCEIVNDDYMVRYVANRDSFFCAPLSRLEAGNNYRYAIQGDTLLLKGFKSKTTRIKYDFPLATMHQPLKYGEELQGVYSGRGEDILDHYVQIFGRYNAKVCGQGTLITLDGDTLKNTLLIHSQRTISSSITNLQEMMNRYHSLDSIPCLSLGGVSDEIEKDSDQLTMDTYSWFAPGYRYAVFETINVHRSLLPQVSILQTAFYNAISDQANLLDDEENQAVREYIERERMGEIHKVQVRNSNKKYISINDKVGFAISKSSSGAKLSIDLCAEENDKFVLSVYNISGMQLYTQDLGKKRRGLYNEQIDIDDLPNGVYVFTIYINGVPFSKELSI